jgi:hypothetical protein
MMARNVRVIIIIGDGEDRSTVIRELRSLIAQMPGSGHSSPQILKADTNSGKVMADLKAKFEKAAEDVKKLSERPDNDTLLKLYALYKQGPRATYPAPSPGSSISSARPNTRPGPN